MPASGDGELPVDVEGHETAPNALLVDGSDNLLLEV
jgi:hypothetical protein